jgi:plasmid maintenance system killer protein
VEIFFRSARLHRVCNSEALLLRTFGRDNGRRIRRRLAVLEAAGSLADVPPTPPERCHALKGDLRGCFAVDVLQPFRIVFSAADVLGRVLAARVAAYRVTSILVIDIRDYH